MNLLERDSFILGLLLMIVMLVVFKELVGVLTIMFILGASLNGVLLVLIDVAMLVSVPALMYKWAPLVDGETK